MFKDVATRRYALFASMRAVIYVLLSLMLVFGCTPPVFADDAAAPGAEGQASESGESPEPEQPPVQPEKPVIEDVSIVFRNTDTALGYASNPNLQRGSITQKGGTLELDTIVYWSTGDQERNSLHATWSTDDPGIASIEEYAGVLTAHADGVVTVYATVSSNTAGGAVLRASAQIDVTGQTDARYVEALRIFDPDGKNITDASYEWENDLATAQAQFTAEVDVVDPATGEKIVYSTANGKLSAQAPDLGDLIWGVGDKNVAAINEETGLLRPSVYGTSSFYVMSKAGKGNATVSATANASLVNPGGQANDNTPHPQDSLTVKVYYQDKTPQDYGEDAYVISKTYSVGELEALGMVTATYSSKGQKASYFMTGTGTPLASVFQDAGVDINRIQEVSFGTYDWPDGFGRPTSGSYIFGDRYYFPNLDVGDYSNAVQVYPILAHVSNEVKIGASEVVTEMTSATRFRLLFGATVGDLSASSQIKWINTLYVKLEGSAPKGNDGKPTDPGNPNPDSGGNGSDKGGAGVGGQSGPDAAGGSGSGEAADRATSGTTGFNSDEAGGSAPSQQRPYSIYQVMGKDETEAEVFDERVNPLRPYAVPLGGLVVVAGGAEAFAWFRFQTRRLVPALA